jgi:hypothetical protein
MSKKPRLSPAPVIAQIISPTTILYELEVFSHEGFVVTRRRRGIGPPQPVFEFSSDKEPSGVEYAAYQDYWHPILNELALVRHGLSSKAKRAELQAWLAVPGNDAFTHPECAPLCLRWGENTDGIHVQKYTIPAGNPDYQAMFIPYSCWQSGLTYYALIDPYDRHFRAAKELKAQGILQEHPEQIGTEGKWHGWYSTNWIALQQALATHRLTPVLVQVIEHYFVCLETAEHKQKWIKHFYLKSEAEELYAQYPENPAYDAFRTNEYPRLIKGASEMLREDGINGWRSGEKVIFKHAK